MGEILLKLQDWVLRDVGYSRETKECYSKEQAERAILDLLAKDRQQLIQRIKEEVIGEDDTDFQGIGEHDLVTYQNELRQTQREILETMEKE